MDCKHEFIYDTEIGRYVCKKCGYALTDEDKREALEYSASLLKGWTNKERFISLCKGIEREGIEDLLNWLEKSDFYTAPASAQFHGSYKGGLLDHSLNVYDELKNLLEVYENRLNLRFTESTIRIVSLLHDLCKVNFYTTEKRNRKDSNGQWESYDFYTVKEKLCYGGHGSKSVFIAQNFINLTAEEAVAINCHMSSWDGNKDVGKAFEQFPLAWLVHVADEASTFLIESKE